MAYSNSSEAIEALAAELGKEVYIDVAKWHLYLRDAHLNTPPGRAALSPCLKKACRLRTRC
ncbi:DUF3181 family protein [Leptolyngbya sp. O-77]|uniref:DUF3181 family protein n=1 Tax=Leptolyngbya sp. O-77 TaxID=1080068 RepID=UPI00074D417D|nr:hypothetical protein O77CONTIG1_03725 [Leptolyngbya sp. O-77]